MLGRDDNDAAADGQVVVGGIHPATVAISVDSADPDGKADIANLSGVAHGAIGDDGEAAQVLDSGADDIADKATGGDIAAGVNYEYIAGLDGFDGETLGITFTAAGSAVDRAAGR